MSNDHEAFEQLGGDVRTGTALPPPFTDASTRDVACAIHAALVEVGLSPAAIRKVASALISVSRIDERAADAPSAREARGENHP